MRTNVEINDTLINEAMKMSELKTKKDVINRALEEFIRALHRERLVKMRGKISFFED